MAHSCFGRFSVNVLLSLCQQSEKRPLAGVVVIGNGQSAHAVAYAGSAMQLPVLWAKGGTTNLRELHPEVTHILFQFIMMFSLAIFDKCKWPHPTTDLSKYLKNFRVLFAFVSKSVLQYPLHITLLK